MPSITLVNTLNERYKVKKHNTGTASTGVEDDLRQVREALHEIDTERGHTIADVASSREKQRYWLGVGSAQAWMIGHPLSNALEGLRNAKAGEKAAENKIKWLRDRRRKAAARRKAVLEARLRGNPNLVEETLLNELHIRT